MSEITVLISDATYKQSIALARYLKASDPSLRVVGCSKPYPWTKKLYQKFYDQWDDGYFPEQIHTIPHTLAIPVGIIATRLLITNNHPHAVIPPLAAFETAMSREDTIALARKLKIAIPKTYFPVSFDGLLNIPIPFPWIVKGVLDSDKNIVRIAHNMEDARKFFYKIQNHFSQHDKPPIIQEFTPGRMIIFNAFYQHGVLKRYYIQHTIRELPCTGGSCTAGETLDHPLVLDYGKKILDALKWNGPAMVVFKEHPETGNLTLIKIDPKFWSSVELGLAAGVNFGDLLLRGVKGEEISFSREYEKIKFFWPFEGDLVSIFQSWKWSALTDYIGSDYQTTMRTNGFLLNMFDLIKGPIQPYN